MSFKVILSHNLPRRDLELSGDRVYFTSKIDVQYVEESTNTIYFHGFVSICFVYMESMGLEQLTRNIDIFTNKMRFTKETYANFIENLDKSFSVEDGTMLKDTFEYVVQIFDTLYKDCKL